MKKIIFLSLFAFHTNAFANLTGEWKGWGSWSFKTYPTECMPMEMTWKESATAIEITQGFFDCGIVAMHLGTTSWTRKDNLLIDETGAEVGTYDGKELNLMMPSPNENTTINVKVKRLRPTAYEYQEIWFNKQEKIYIIEGKFFNSLGKE